LRRSEPGAGTGARADRQLQHCPVGRHRHQRNHSPASL